MRSICMTLALLVVALTASAQVPQKQPKATEQVVARYERLIASGALLTPAGWKTAAKLFYESKPYPSHGTINVTTGATPEMIGEMWIQGDRADVQTKWTDDLGSIDSALHYKPKPDPRVVMTAYDYRMIYTNKHREIDANGKVTETVDSWEWKLEGPQEARWTTADHATEYVVQMRDKSDDPVLKANAEKTIAALKRLHVVCGTASAC